MAIEDYISQNQPLVFRTFQNALTRNRLCHAYLLSGESGIPLKETAIYLAKSILCDHPNPFADLCCRTCCRIDQGQYPDFIFINGEEGSIKKEDVSYLLSSFQQTALEKKGLLVYVIHELENMTPEAINSILKFLEEPPPNTYAILTTRNASKILPTIVSRCEEIRMMLVPQRIVKEEAIALGLDPLDAEILSFFHNDASLAKEYAEDEDYKATKESFLTALESLENGEDYARFIMEKDVVPVVNSKKNARFFFDMMTLALKDIVSMSRGGSIALESYASTFQAVLPALKNPDKALLAIMTLRGEIEANIQIGLLLIHLIHELFQE